MNYTGWCHCSCSRKRTAGPTGEQHSIVDRAREPVLAALAAAAAVRAGPPPPPPPARGNVGGSSARLIAQCCADMSSCGSGSLPASSSITNGSSPFMVSLRRGDGGHGMHSIPSREGLRGDPPPPTPLPPQRRRPAAGFPYPVALTMWHMFFCAALAFVIIKLGYVEPVTMSVDTCEQRGGGWGGAGNPALPVNVWSQSLRRVLPFPPLPSCCRRAHDCAHRIPVCRHPLAGQLRVCVPLRLLHPDAQGGWAAAESGSHSSCYR